MVSTMIVISLQAQSSTDLYVGLIIILYTGIYIFQNYSGFNGCEIKGEISITFGYMGFGGAASGKGKLHIAKLSYRLNFT